MSYNVWVQDIFANLFTFIMKKHTNIFVLSNIFYEVGNYVMWLVFYCEVVSCGLGLPSILHCQGELVAMLGNKECLLKTIDDGNI
jgi:hypothetical protein